jgi:hypothetical protein
LKLLIIPFCYFIPRRNTKYLPQHPLLEHPQTVTLSLKAGS